MRIDVISVLPEVFEPYASASMLGLARERGILEFVTHDLREWALPGVHRQVDDSPYGGGAGMVMRPEPWFEAIEAVVAADDRPARVVLMSPQGRPLTQRDARRLSGLPRMIILCGRYEGFDERVRSLADEEVSVGDYVLTGGELPALIVVDAVVRLIPGVLGAEASAEDDSFSEGLLEYPHYTRPADYRGMSVPEVLLSGDHARIARWRRQQAVLRTARVRPDLIGPAWDSLSDEERALVDREREDLTEEA